MRKSLPVLIAAMILPVLGAKQFAPPDLAMPENYVDDLAHVINAEHGQALNGILQELEQKTGVQYIILTVETTRACRLSNSRSSCWTSGSSARRARTTAFCSRWL